MIPGLLALSGMANSDNHCPVHEEVNGECPSSGQQPRVELPISKVPKASRGMRSVVKRDFNIKKQGLYCYVLTKLRLEENGLVTLRFNYETQRGYTCARRHRIYDI